MKCLYVMCSYFCSATHLSYKDSMYLLFASWLKFFELVHPLPVHAPSPQSFTHASLPPSSFTQVVKKFVKESGVVDGDAANVIGAVADGVENQAEAGRDASVTDRLKMASKLL